MRGALFIESDIRRGDRNFGHKSRARKQWASGEASRGLQSISVAETLQQAGGQAHLTSGELVRGLACLQASERTNCLRPRERSSFCAPRRTRRRDSKAYPCRRWPLAGSRGEAPGCFSWFILLQKQENECVYNAIRHSFKNQRKPHGRATSKIIVVIRNIRKAAFCNAPSYRNMCLFSFIVRIAGEPWKSTGS